MGSFIEINDTLRIDKSQGFPAELDVDKHFENPFQADDFKDKIFEFSSKKDIRIYKVPPVRNFLVEDIGGKWLYWGQCHITEITHDYINMTTSGKYKITHINTPQEMETAFKMIDSTGSDYFPPKRKELLERFSQILKTKAENDMPQSR